MDQAADELERLVASDPAVEEFVQQKLPTLRRLWEPQHVILFGSHCRGAASEGSDIDLVVVSRKFGAVPWPNRAAAVLRAIYPRRSVDVLCYTPEEFEQKRREAGIVATACEEGIWL